MTTNFFGIGYHFKIFRSQVATGKKVNFTPCSTVNTVYFDKTAVTKKKFTSKTNEKEMQKKKCFTLHPTTIKTMFSACFVLKFGRSNHFYCVFTETIDSNIFKSSQSNAQYQTMKSQLVR